MKKLTISLIVLAISIQSTFAANTTNFIGWDGTNSDFAYGCIAGLLLFPIFALIGWGYSLIVDKKKTLTPAK